MTLAPRARVIVTPYAGPARRGLVVSKVNELDAYVVRFSNGDRHTVPAHHIEVNDDNAKGEKS